MRSSSRQPFFTFTKSFRKIFVPSSFSASRRASVPICFQHAPALADQDALLRVAFHVDDSGIRVMSGLFLHFLDDHRRGIRDLLLRKLKDLFPDKLGHNEPLRLVRQLVVGKVLRALGQTFQDRLDKTAKVVLER